MSSTWIRKVMFAAMLAVAFSGCAQDVGDIDRTQSNLLAKKEFEGVWYFRQTITDVPAQVDYTFVGYSSAMEKIRWDIRENYLIAYRSYEYQPGTDSDAGPTIRGETRWVDGASDVGFSKDDFAEQPIAAFAIQQHVDVQRQYNPSTGEQTNVIVENGSDRFWKDRDYIRVDWSTNYVHSFNFLTDMDSVTDMSYFVDAIEGGPDAFHSERQTRVRDGEEREEMTYFDFTNKLSLQPDMEDCWYYDRNCIPGEVKIRNSFYRLKDQQRDYEPAFYDDRAMNKFGYFRSTRDVYDRREGFTDEQQLFFANRHDIWRNDYKRDESGEYLRDADGQRIPVPMAEREPKPIVYYLSPNMPDPIIESSLQIGDDWDKAFTRTVAAVKGMKPGEVADQYGPMFIVCHNPVTADDAEACDPRGASLRTDDEGNPIPFSPRIGDLRYSFMWWVDQPQAAGPLGYGPPFADPETGEIIAGTAYIYGAGVDNYAQFGVDTVKMVNGDYSDEELELGVDVQDYLKRNLRDDIDPRARWTDEQFARLDDIELDEIEQTLNPRQQAIVELVRDNPNQEVFDPGVLRHEQILQRFEEAGLGLELIDSEMLNVIPVPRGQSLDTMPDADRDRLLDAFNPLDMRQRLQRKNAFYEKLGRQTVYMAEFADPAVEATALKYEGQDDYEKIWNDVRGNIFRGVGAHEVGHSIGLRHNFQGSYDAINYFDNYWELRKENLPTTAPQSLADFYVLSEQTPTQVEEGMRKYQYSSIMDYHARFDGDWNSVGKYDSAAILHAYSYGTYKEVGADNEGPIPQEAGYVEVFESMPDAAANLIRQYDDRTSPADRDLLEDWHYSTVIQRMGNDPSILKDRKLVRYSKLKKQQDGGDSSRDLEVPYMFCSDEIAGALVSCNRWDLGADPMEIVKTARDDYFTYYPLTHFRRSRLNFDPMGPLNRSYRTMRTFLTVYQQWLIGNQDVGDDLLNTYYILATGLGFNEMVKTMTMPRYGSYQMGDDGMLQWQSYEGGGGTVIPKGEGRRLRSIYDVGSGYYYFDRMEESGHFWDWLGALMVAIEPVARTVAVDTAADREAYLVPFYLVFEDELTGLFNGSVHEEFRSFQPRIDNEGSIVYPPAFTLDAGVPIDPGTGAPAGSFDTGTKTEIPMNLTQQRYAALYGVAFFNELYTQHYVDQARVFKMGHGDALTVEAGEGYEVISFTDPATGQAYGTIRPEGGSQSPDLGETLVVRGQEIEAEMAANPDDRQLEFDMSQVVDTVNMLTTIIDFYGAAD